MYLFGFAIAPWVVPALKTDLSGTVTVLDFPKAHIHIVFVVSCHDDGVVYAIRLSEEIYVMAHC